MSTSDYFRANRCWQLTMMKKIDDGDDGDCWLVVDIPDTGAAAGAVEDNWPDRDPPLRHRKAVAAVDIAAVVEVDGNMTKKKREIRDWPDDCAIGLQRYPMSPVAS